MKKKSFSKYELNYIYDEPVIFKSLTIYPVLVKDYLQFNTWSKCLSLDKNSSKDPKTISMTYLDYMYTLHNDENPYISFFDAILKIVTRKRDLDVRYARNEKGKPVFFIEGIEYNHSDFEEIRMIICEYNLVDLPDEYIQKEIRDNMQKAKELRAKSNGVKIAPFEDRLVCVSISTGWDFDRISKLSIRKFEKILEREDAKLHYQIYLSASMSGFVEFKSKSFIKHWMSDLSEDKLDLVPLEQIQGTVSGKNAKVRNKRKK
jgi:hypothetical protein